MTSRLTRTLGVTALLAMGIIWATTAASSASSGSGDRGAAPGHRSTYPPAARAVRADMAQAAGIAAAAVPADFESVMGYRPRVRHGLLVDPAGTCSSPIPLPGEFAPACAEHDLGYDLLRYADLTGDPLDAWARTAIDDRLAQRMRAVCARRGPGPERAVCSAAALVATTAVELNSERQLRGVPKETLASWAVTVAGLVTIVSTVVSALLVGRGRRRRQPRPSGVSQEVPA